MAEVQRIHMIRTTNSNRGQDFVFGRDYDVSPKYARRMVNRGHARLFEDVLVEKLKFLWRRASRHSADQQGVDPSSANGGHRHGKGGSMNAVQSTIPGSPHYAP